MLTESCYTPSSLDVLSAARWSWRLMLSLPFQIKIGDFGLATKVGFEGERKRTLCGTPNYIAPEVLGKKGHSYEVRIKALNGVFSPC